MGKLKRTNLSSSLITELDSISTTSSSLTELSGKVDVHSKDNSHVFWIADATGINSLDATYTPVTAYYDGLGVSFKVVTSSTAATTLNINSLGAIPIVNASGKAVTNLKANGIYTLRYLGGKFILQGEAGEYGTAIAADVRSTKTISTENGIVSGALNLTNLIPANIRNGVVIDGIMGTVNSASGNHYDNIVWGTTTGRTRFEIDDNLFVVIYNDTSYNGRGDGVTLNYYTSAGVLVRTLNFLTQYYCGSILDVDRDGIYIHCSAEILHYTAYDKNKSILAMYNHKGVFIKYLPKLETEYLLYSIQSILAVTKDYFIVWHEGPTNYNEQQYHRLIAIYNMNGGVVAYSSVSYLKTSVLPIKIMKFSSKDFFIITDTTWILLRTASNGAIFHEINTKYSSYGPQFGSIDALSALIKNFAWRSR